ncbi:MAG: metalloregulator ArsR/SmtB family transcription factor [Victivallaceae bacterium]|jgi:ArsR family transcriptional regulator|nr:metalloregulator ArsR/SmtB family transcription factor [Victivallaceae bacterium]MDD3116905.1 metalloregulator ArsR/SmtB family transcription factor [Victivallaceae bacterium]MDD3703105.1 metalloregulator ArsR/SmtB family transcription factor [Victivallaceae bacterium]MDD4316983.1 metalloregulator ArsR/SmtB family transcription factor [Victivallaceae bacterium]NLK83879.1 winged helix-turn-helix transcriptional regulator [Lentisphaerota bacterium]
MLKFEKNCCKEEAEVFKALGHPTRLWIVEQLADGQEHCVCEFVDAVGVDFSTISQHLQILKRAGVIEDDKRGKQVYYRLRCICVTEFISCLKKR